MEVDFLTRIIDISIALFICLASGLVAFRFLKAQLNARDAIIDSKDKMIARLHEKMNEHALGSLQLNLKVNALLESMLDKQRDVELHVINEINDLRELIVNQHNIILRNINSNE